MGAENSVLEGCVWEAPLQSTLPWEIFPVTKPDGSTATVFRPQREEKKDRDLLRKNIAVIRGIRHPNIIRYVDGVEARDNTWLATEQVKPLTATLSNLTVDEIFAGLQDLLQAVDFLHSKLGMCHNNLSLSSLFVGPDGTWKLGEMQHACKFSDATPAFLDQCRAFRDESVLSPEEKAGTVKLEPATGHARDMFAFGVIVETLLEDVTLKGEGMKALEAKVAACLNTEPAKRPTATSFLNMPFMRSDLFEVIDFLKNIPMKSDADKKDFFNHLVPRLRSLPEPVLARRLVIPLLARFVLLDERADSEVVPYLLTPRTEAHKEGLLGEDLYKQHVIPQLYNIFHVHDCHIRLVLLQHFHSYVHLFSRNQLEDDIFLQILLGVRDSEDRVVAASLRALAELVPILGGDVVVGGTRKPFFFHGLPKQVNPEDLAKLSAAQNLTSVLSSHKPLLKDLAAGSSSSQLRKERSQEEKERKAREREQRREEAKLKREERRKRLKEKQIDNEGSDLSQTSPQKELSAMTIEDFARLDSEAGDGLATEEKNKINHNVVHHASNEEVGVEGEEKSYKFKMKDGDSNRNLNANNSINDKKAGSAESIEAADEEKERNEAELDEEPDWSDWEDTDQRIEQEIEEELHAMSDLSDLDTGGGGGGAEDEAKVQTSPSPYRHQISHNASLLGWSHDLPEAERDLSRPGGHDSHPAALNIETMARISKDTNTGKGRSLKLKSSSSSASQNIPTVTTAGKPSSTDNQGKATAGVKSRPPMGDLGAGLDIKSVEIKVKAQPELDFFADMAPSIKPVSTVAVGADVPAVPAEREESRLAPSVEDAEVIKHKVNSKLFAVSTDPQQGDVEPSGWEDDDTLDWDAEDF